MSRTPFAALLLVALSAAPSAQVVFDTFDDGSISDVFLFDGNSAAGISAEPTTGRTGAANTALSVRIDPNLIGGYAGFVLLGDPGMVDVSGTNTLTFFFRPTQITAENGNTALTISLHEDVDGNGAYDGMIEDEVQARFNLPSAPGYTAVSIPLASFVDTAAGANDGFDYSKLLQIVMVTGGPFGPAYTFALDDVVFTQVTPTGPPQTTFDDFNDGDVSDVFPFSGNNNMGIDLGLTAGANGAPASALRVQVRPADIGGFAGFALPGAPGAVDVSGSTTFAFAIRPNGVTGANLPLTLVLNLHEDTNGDGVYDSAVDDEFQTFYSVVPGGSYRTVTIPLSQFVDAGTAGANDGFDYTKLLEVIVVMGGPVGPPFEFALDNIGFTAGGPVASEAPALSEALVSVYPNPSAGRATVAFSLAHAQPVTVRVIDLLGRTVETLAAGVQPAGPVRLEVGSGLPAGVYVVRVETAQSVSASRLTVAR